MLAHSGSKLTSAREFVDVCEEQGIQLNDGLISSHYTTQYRPARKLLAVAAWLLREGPPGMALANTIIEETVHPGDDVSSILRRVINTTINPLDVVPGFSFSRHSDRVANSCRFAETDFARTLNAIKQMQVDNKPPGEYGGEIFVDEDGQAVILRKSKGFSSGLALADSSIGGTLVPKGALLYVETPEGRQGYNILPGDRFHIRPMDDVVDIGMTRLTGFASSPGQREIHHLAEFEAGEEAYALLTTIGANALQPLVQTAVDSLAIAI